MLRNVDESGILSNKTINKESLIIPDILFEEFQNSLTLELIKNLYLKLKTHEIKGYISHDKFIESMKEIFDELIKNKILILYNENKISKSDIINNQNLDEYIHEIYELYFLRFREIKCIIKNNKTIFYLTDLKPENHINTYNIICSLVVLMKNPFDTKIKLLFELSDIDEDGFLNENEIRHMITTCNFLFCEERNGINMNSTILSQSLMNIKVNEILKQILYEPGNLYSALEKEKYINFTVFYNSIKKVKNYKFDILPNFVNLKCCLNNKKVEKIIKVENKYKKDFVNITSGFFNQKVYLTQNLFHKSASASSLGKIIKPKQIKDETDKLGSINTKYDLPNLKRTFNYKKKNSLGNSSNSNTSNKTLNVNKNNSDKLSLGQTTKTLTISPRLLFSNKYRLSRNKKNRSKLFIEKKKTFKDLLKESTILDNDEEKENTNEDLKNFSKSSYFNRAKEAKYFFEAYLDKIRSMEVKPGLIQFIQPNQDIDKDNSSGSGTNRNINIINNNNNTMNDMNKNIVDAKRKINSEKNKNEKLTSLLRLSSKSILDELKKDFKNYVIKEDVLGEEKEKEKEDNKNNFKKFKIITNQNKSNKSIHKTHKQTLNTFKRNNTKNLTSFKIVPKLEKNVRIRNYSFNQKKRPSIFSRKKISIINIKNDFNIQKNIIDSNLKNTNINKYKTLDEVFSEINKQETKFMNDYGGYSIGMINVLEKIVEEKNELKRFLNQGERNEGERSLIVEYFNRILRLLQSKNNKKKEKEKKSEN